MARTPGIEELPYAGAQSVEQLRGPSGLLLALHGTGEKLIAWEPTTRRAHDLELRARIVSSSGGLGSITNVRWHIAIGHGKVVYREPFLSLQIISGEVVNLYSLPARGMLLRLNARELRVTFQLAAPIAGPVITNAQIQVSIQPTHGAHLPVLPYQHLVFPAGVISQPFPMEAREWRLTDHLGLPFAPAAVAVSPIGISGALLGIIDGAALADWHPIPHDAATFRATAPCYAVYR